MLQLLATPLLVGPWRDSSAPSFIVVTLDAAGESYGGIGTVTLSTGQGTSKVLSAAGGGKIVFLPSTNTFANGGTTLRVGVQDVSGNIEDGTHDVYGELTGGVDTLTAGALKTVTMGTGSKTIADGDRIAIVVEMTARGGADSVQVLRGTTQGFLQAHVSADTGSGPAVVAASPIIAIIFDDGTVGWLYGTNGAYADGSLAVTPASTPDEYAIVLTPTIPLRVVGVSASLLGASGSLDTGIATLYSDPSGTPVAERTASFAGTTVSTSTGTWWGRFASAFDLVVGTPYAFAFAVTGSSISIQRLAYGSGNGALRAATPFGTNWRQGTRTDGSGAFSNDAADAEFLPYIGLIVQGFDNGVSVGGGVIGGPTKRAGLQ